MFVEEGRKQGRMNSANTVKSTVPSIASRKGKKIRKEEIHSEINIHTNVNMSSFNPQVEHILSLVSLRNNDMRQTLAAYIILDYK